MRILIITPDYPDNKRSVFTFVKQLVDQFAQMGHDCCVIAPYRITNNKGFYKFIETQKLGNGSVVYVLRPNYISLSNIKIFGFEPSNFFRKLSLRKALKKIPFKPDIVYAHFWRSGAEIYDFAKKNNLPLFVATGESEFSQEDIDPKHQAFFDYVKGVICVSSNNMTESIQNGMTIPQKCLLAPNSINPKLFYKLDKADCRKKLNLPDNSFIIAFCGAFIHRKGVRMLSDAIDTINDIPVFSLFIGRPMEELPSCRNILFQGPVKHEQLIDYLNSADIFVLPTLNEGCCNAIIEAMACGLPIVSSDRAFNWDVLDKSNSLLIDPEDPKSIAGALVSLRDNTDLRKQLSEGAIRKARDLTIEKRAERILEFIKSKL